MRAGWQAQAQAQAARAAAQAQAAAVQVAAAAQAAAAAERGPLVFVEKCRVDCWGEATNILYTRVLVTRRKGIYGGRIRGFTLGCWMVLVNSVTMEGWKTTAAILEGIWETKDARI